MLGPLSVIAAIIGIECYRRHGLMVLIIADSAWVILSASVIVGVNMTSK